VHQFILASGSPRRKELLEQVGYNFSIIRPRIDESIVRGESAKEHVTRLAIEKAVDVDLRNGGNAVVLAADTIVLAGDEILGKPVDKNDAIRMLCLLSGDVHRVMTATVAQQKDRVEMVLVETLVRFKPLSRDECERYWFVGESQDKAGAYGIQGRAAIFVAGIEGSYSNVVGLPLKEVAELLLKFGIESLPVVPERIYTPGQRQVNPDQS